MDPAPQFNEARRCAIKQLIVDHERIRAMPLPLLQTRLNLLRLTGVLALVIPLLAAAAGGTATRIEVGLRARVEISPDGGITALAWEKQAPHLQMISQAIESDVRTWKFTPGTVDGRPAATETHLSVIVQATEGTDGSMALSFVRASTGAGWVGVVVPNYPAQAARGNVDAKLVAIVDFDEHGKGAIRSYEYDSSGGNPRMRKEFLASTEEAITAWKVEPERVAGRPLASSFRIPFVFCVSPRCPFGLDKTDRESVDGSDDKQPVALGSVAKLLTMVEGRTVGGG